VWWSSLHESDPVMTRCSWSVNGYFALLSGGEWHLELPCMDWLFWQGSRWKVLCGSADSNVLCSVKIFWGLLCWKTAIKVFLASNLSERQPDYMVELRKICGSDCIILHGTRPMSEVCVRKIFGLLIRWLILNILEITQPSWRSCYRCIMLLINLIHDKIL
jgi:hypothetical protein